MRVQTGPYLAQSSVMKIFIYLFPFVFSISAFADNCRDSVFMFKVRTEQAEKVSLQVAHLEWRGSLKDPQAKNNAIREVNRVWGLVYQSKEEAKSVCSQKISSGPACDDALDKLQGSIIAYQTFKITETPAEKQNINSRGEKEFHKKLNEASEQIDAIQNSVIISCS